MKKSNEYTRHSIADISFVFDLMNMREKEALPDEDKKRLKISVNNQLVKMGSLRLRTFRHKGTVCDACGLVATHFALEKATYGNDESYHLNLWAKQGKNEVLFTHDHLVCRAVGGKDHLDNSRTCCSQCNHQKSLMETALCAEFKANPEFVITEEWIRQNYVGVSEAEVQKVIKAFLK